jgi:hypothetical protein
VVALDQMRECGLAAAAQVGNETSVITIACLMIPYCSRRGAYALHV